METFVYPQTERYLGMALFIFYTTCAMMMRWVPGVKEVVLTYQTGNLDLHLFQLQVRSWMLPICLLAIFASWWCAAIISSAIWEALPQFF